MKVPLFRMTLKEAKEKPLVEGRTGTLKNPTRLEFLSEWFGEKFDYEGARKSDFQYAARHIDGGVFVGEVGRWVEEDVASDQNDLRNSQIQGRWETAWLFANLENDNQIIAIEPNTKCGTPSEVINRIKDRINSASLNSSYLVETMALPEPGKFLDVVRNSKKPLTSLEITLVPDNADLEQATKGAFGELVSDLDSEITAIRAENRTSGLNKNSVVLDQGQRKSERGEAELVAKYNNSVLYSTKHHNMNIDMPRELIRRAHDEARWGPLVSFIRQVFVK